eukprot:1054305-Ditylum_brightwellii.AAC.1
MNLSAKVRNKGCDNVISMNEVLLGIMIHHISPESKLVFRVISPESEISRQIIYHFSVASC